MITSSSVGGLYLPPLTDALVQEGLRRSANKREIVVTQELLEKGFNIVSPWNTKRKTGQVNWIYGYWEMRNTETGIQKIWHPPHLELVKERLRNCPEEEKEARIAEMSARRHFPNWITKLAYPAGMYWAPKPDMYGLPFGKIEQFDHDESAKAMFYSSAKMKELFESGTEYGAPGEHYSDYALAREFVEETGLVAVRKKTNAGGHAVCEPLFERLVRFYQYDRNDPDNQTVDHEVFFFEIKYPDGELNTVGVPEETEPPEILPILSLNPGNFYNKHAHGLMYLLRKFVRDFGWVKYDEPLKHLETTFPPCPMLRQAPSVVMPSFDLPDEKMWDEFTKKNNFVEFADRKKEL